MLVVLWLSKKKKKKTTKGIRKAAACLTVTVPLGRENMPMLCNIFYQYCCIWGLPPPTVVSNKKLLVDFDCVRLRAVGIWFWLTKDGGREHVAVNTQSRLACINIKPWLVKLPIG